MRQLGDLLHKGVTTDEATALMAKYTDEAKAKGITTKQHLESLAESKTFRNRVNEFYKNLKFIQPNGKKFRIYEVESAVDLEKYFLGKLRASKKGEAGDFIVQNGKYARKSVDAMGLYNDVRTKTRWSNDYNRNLNKFKDAVDRHFMKMKFPNANNPSTTPLDYVAIDFRYFDDVSPNLRNDVLSHINNPNYIHKHYVKNNLIKLNF